MNSLISSSTFYAVYVIRFVSSISSHFIVYMCMWYKYLVVVSGGEDKGVVMADSVKEVTPYKPTLPDRSDMYVVYPCHPGQSLAMHAKANTTYC